MLSAYQKEDFEFLQSIKRVPRSFVSKDANTIGSHVVYKLKLIDEESFKLKGRIATNGLKHSNKASLLSECCMCSCVGICMTLVISTYNGWRLIRICGKTALQNCPGSRDVYVILPREFAFLKELWLLLVAAYELVSLNAKRQIQSDEAFHFLGLEQIIVVPQLFYQKQDGEVVLVVVKIVDDIFAIGKDDAFPQLATHF